jgi:TRAP-type mannitol/chloroaromatic compound transport system permease small subunit
VILAIERAAVTWTRRLALVGGWLLLGVAFATVADALLRYLFSRPLQGTFEAVELLLAVVIFFGLPYTGLVDAHISVDFLTARLAARGQYTVIALNALVAAALLALITVEMIALAGEYAATGRTTINARIPVLPFLIPAAGAAGLAAAGFVLQAIGAGLRALRPGLPPLPNPGS